MTIRIETKWIAVGLIGAVVSVPFVKNVEGIGSGLSALTEFASSLSVTEGNATEEKVSLGSEVEGNVKETKEPEPVKPVNQVTQKPAKKNPLTKAEKIRDIKGVWWASVANIDSPPKPGLSVQEQKAEIRELLDAMKKAGLNTVFFQVRPSGDALYRNSKEPWSAYLTGTQGKDPDPEKMYDPLQYLIEETNKRQMTVHAWLNPLRAQHETTKVLSVDHLSRRKPSTTVQYGKQKWFKPSDEIVHQHLEEVIIDLLKHYGKTKNRPGIEGIHFDDYFYPYAVKDGNGTTIPFPDEAEYNQYLAKSGRAAKLSRSDWRRDNVYRLVKRISLAIKRYNPEIIFGISPFGTIRGNIPSGIVSFDQYEGLYFDISKIMKERLIDYVAPQIYWDVSPGSSTDFQAIHDSWQILGKETETIVCPGLAFHQINLGTMSTGNLKRQFKLIEQGDKCFIGFSAKYLKTNEELRETIKEGSEK